MLQMIGKEDGIGLFKFFAYSDLPLAFRVTCAKIHQARTKPVNLYDKTKVARYHFAYTYVDLKG